MKNRKSRVLKAMGFSSLALVMGAIGTLAFAPLQSTQISSASEAEMTTEQGLITPKADDTVIYTTESGLDIKWGNAIGDALGGGNEEAFSNLSSGNLKNLPYFTTKSGSTTYTWVIIGQNLSSYNDFSYQNLTYWQTNKSQSTTYTYFFNNIYETTTPAGSAIKNNNLLNDYAARKIVGISLLSSVTKNTTEIPSGCVLVLANDCVATGAFNVDNNTDGNNNNDYVPRYRNGETIVKAMQGYYNNKSFGLSSISSSIQVISTLKTYGYSYYDNNGTGWFTTNLSNQYIYPLSPHASGNFYWQNYLTSSQIKLSKKQWLRASTNTHPNDVDLKVGEKYYHPCDCIDTTGTQQNEVAWVNDTTVGYRPAFCLKI